MGDGNSSSQDGVVLDVVDQEAGVVEHLDDVADCAHLNKNEVKKHCCLEVPRLSKILGDIFR